MSTRDAIIDRISILVGQGYTWQRAAEQAREELGCPVPDVPPPHPDVQIVRRPHRSRRRRWTARAAARVVCQAALHESVGGDADCEPRDGARVVREAIAANDCARRVVEDEGATEEIERLLDALLDARDIAQILIILIELLLALAELLVGKLPSRVLRYLREVLRRLRAILTPGPLKPK